MYTPNPGFMRHLKSLDQRLDCYYESDWERFVVTYRRPHGKPIPLFQVKTAAGGFRQPDLRDIMYLKQWDMEEMTATERLTKVTSYMETIREFTQRKRRENIRGWTKDDRIQLMQVFGRLYGGKSNSAFRRINVKPRAKGEQFKIEDKRFLSSSAA